MKTVPGTTKTTKNDVKSMKTLPGTTKTTTNDIEVNENIDRHKKQSPVANPSRSKSIAFLINFLIKNQRFGLRGLGAGFPGFGPRSKCIAFLINSLI